MDAPPPGRTRPTSENPVRPTPPSPRPREGTNRTSESPMDAHPPSSPGTGSFSRPIKPASNPATQPPTEKNPAGNCACPPPPGRSNRTSETPNPRKPAITASRGRHNANIRDPTDAHPPSPPGTGSFSRPHQTSIQPSHPAPIRRKPSGKMCLSPSAGAQQPHIRNPNPRKPANAASQATHKANIRAPIDAPPPSPPSPPHKTPNGHPHHAQSPHTHAKRTTPHSSDLEAANFHNLVVAARRRPQVGVLPCPRARKGLAESPPGEAPTRPGHEATQQKNRTAPPGPVGFIELGNRLTG